MSEPGDLLWFARHEARLVWRDWLAMMTAGRRGRERMAMVIVLLFIAMIHVIAFIMVARFADVDAASGPLTLLIVTGSLMLAFSLMASQAMESLTRAFYARADLDLLLSSPIPARTVFCVRIAVIALSTMTMAVLLAAPFINVLAFSGGARWLCAYGVIMAIGAVATAFALVATLALFRLIGPKRTRFVAQIIAAVVGASFVIGLQVGAIVSYGNMSRFALLQSDAVVAHAPAADSILWWPARGVFGDIAAMTTVMAVAFVLLVVAMTTLAAAFARYAGATTGVAQAAAARPFRWSKRYARSPAEALRHKEWMLLLRDPWLVSQSLMQILYLLPPALFLWRSFHAGIGALVVITPVLVMAAGQLSGGLAWLAVSGEDAPELIATAPITTTAVSHAKIEAIIGCIALVFAPFILALTAVSPFYALIAALGIAMAGTAAVVIQFSFRSQAKRSHFRRRQTSSRLATFAEAFASIAVAATSALAASGSGYALVTAVISVGIVVGAWMISPAHTAAGRPAAPRLPSKTLAVAG